MREGAIQEPPSEPRMSLEAWAAMPEDEPGELVDGRLVEEEVADITHEVVVSWLVRTLGNWIDPRGGYALGSEVKIAATPGRGRKPDVCVFLPGRQIPPRGIVRVPPDLIVEVVSPTPKDGRRDRVEKLQEYAAFGVRWYWIVDPRLRSLEIFELGADGRYAHALGATSGVVEKVPGCEDLTLDLDAIWERIDRLGAEDEEAEGEGT